MGLDFSKQKNFVFFFYFRSKKFFIYNKKRILYLFCIFANNFLKIYLKIEKFIDFVLKIQNL